MQSSARVLEKKVSRERTPRGATARAAAASGVMPPRLDLISMGTAGSSVSATADGAAAAVAVAASATSPAFSVGDKVIVSGLSSRPELTGAQGNVLSFDGERYAVYLDGSTEGVGI